MIRIDFGDGTSQTFDSETVRTEITHTYADSGTKTITISFERNEAEKDLQARIDKNAFENEFGRINQGWVDGIVKMFPTSNLEPVDPKELGWYYPNGETDINAMLRGERKKS